MHENADGADRIEIVAKEDVNQTRHSAETGPEEKGIAASAQNGVKKKFPFGGHGGAGQDPSDVVAPRDPDDSVAVNKKSR